MGRFLQKLLSRRVGRRAGGNFSRSKVLQTALGLEWPIRGLEDSKDLAIGPTTIPRARSNLERTLA